ncbi:MAG: hypothetical protein ACR2FP_07725 [Nocardioidaceae bacterium]
MTTTDSSLTKLEAQARAAEAKAARARADAERAAAVEAERREARLVEYDQASLAAFDPAKLEADWRQAEADLHQAIRSSTVGQAWINFMAAAMRRNYLHEEARGTAARLGVPTQVHQVSPGGAPDFFEVARILSDEASHAAYDQNVRRGEDRQAYGEAANDGT